MDIISIGAIVGGVFVPLASLLYAVTRNLKKDQRAENDKLQARLNTVERDSLKHDESIKRVHSRVDAASHEHDKLETSVESKLDKFEDKLDRILEYMIRQKDN